MSAPTTWRSSRGRHLKSYVAKIVETTYYKLPPNQKNPEDRTSPRAISWSKKNWPQYYRPDVLGGKTGYTSIALNTLVNGARQGDTTLITVILHSNNTQYEDTSRLLDLDLTISSRSKLQIMIKLFQISEKI